jgi:hypothetical protein
MQPLSPYEDFLIAHGKTLSQESGDTALIMCGDDNAILASQETNYYPFSMVMQLLRKDLMSSSLGSYGFNALELRKLKSINDLLGMTNFIIKPIVGSNRTNIVPGAIPIDFEYQKFANLDALVAGRNIDTLNEQLADGLHIAQQAQMSNDYKMITISGTVNGAGEVYFRRNGKLYFENDQCMHQVRDFRGLEAEHGYLRTMLSSVRNAAFTLQSIVIDGQMYPMDWNFRPAYRTVMHELHVHPEEFNVALAHQFDISYTPTTAINSDMRWYLDGFQTDPARVYSEVEQYDPFTIEG